MKELQTPKNDQHHHANRGSKSVSSFTRRTHQSSILSRSPVISASPDTVALYDLTPLTSTVTKVEKPNSISVFHSGFAESKGNDDIATVEADVVVNHLKLARTKLMDSTDVDVSSLKLLDALVKTVMEQHDGLHKEKDQFAELVTMKSRLVFVCIMAWILVVSVTFIFRNCGGRSSFVEPLPT